MTDRISKEMRSRIMSKIRRKDTGPEIMLKKAIRGLGFSYQPKMRIRADFVNRKSRVLVFVDGDFWHGYSWKIQGKAPPKGFWQDKILRNIERDKRQTRQLKKDGWKVIRVWEHQIKQELDSCVSRIKDCLE